MVIEANRDAAKECVFKATEAFKRNDIEKMRNLLLRAKKLDPNCDVDSILHKSNKIPKNKEFDLNYTHDDHYNETNNFSNLKNQKNFNDKQTSCRSETKQQPSTSKTQRIKSRSKSGTRNGFRETKNEDGYTKEDYEMVQRIRHSKDYYEILQIQNNDFSVSQLKKKYYELALKLHPDKCKVPGATEAFKALGNAYGVLSDPKKREEYDRYGPENERQATTRYRNSSDFYEYDVGRGFESEMSPEDIFEMFFGTGLTRNSMHRRRTHFFHENGQDEQNSARREETSLYDLIKILPILVIIFGGLIMQLFVGEPPYSLNRDSTYYIQRFTKDLRIPYFVKSDFEAQYGKKLRQIEQHVEDDYLTMLRTNCYREKNQKESLLWTAKLRGDVDLWRRAQETKLTYCKKLEELYR